MLSEKIKISAVKYANTYPFLYGIYETGFDKKVIIETDHPADCAEKLISGKVDIGLIPVAVLPQLKQYYIITDYCLGAFGNVRTVMLLSNCPVEEIESVYLDYRSRSSVNLVKILAKNAWKKEFRWINTTSGFDFINIKKKEAVVLIGDQCVEFENRYKYKIDLSGEWYNFTGLPFVFACWTANKKLNEDFIAEFNRALSQGVNNIPEVVKKYGKEGTIKGYDLQTYLTKNMNFDLNEGKRKAISLFLDYMSKL